MKFYPYKKGEGSGKSFSHTESGGGAQKVATLEKGGGGGGAKSFTLSECLANSFGPAIFPF